MIEDFKVRRVSSVHRGTRREHVFEVSFKGGPEDDRAAELLARGVVLRMLLLPGERRQFEEGLPR
ncbi:MAG: hypothetical protein ACREE2_02525 [Stellaceae bacterium]